jgi:hypothetical protein
MKVGSDNNPSPEPRQDRKVATVKEGGLVVRSPDPSRTLFAPLYLPTTLSHDRK